MYHTKNNDLHNILANICSEEQIEEISKLIAESNTKEELHNSLAKVYKNRLQIFTSFSGQDICDLKDYRNPKIHAPLMKIKR